MELKEKILYTYNYHGRKVKVVLLRYSCMYSQTLLPTGNRYWGTHVGGNYNLYYHFMSAQELRSRWGLVNSVLRVYASG